MAPLALEAQAEHLKLTGFELSTLAHGSWPGGADAGGATAGALAGPAGMKH
jgi:hypothetical protein